MTPEDQDFVVEAVMNAANALSAQMHDDMQEVVAANNANRYLLEVIFSSEFEGRPDSFRTLMVELMRRTREAP